MEGLNRIIFLVLGLIAVVIFFAVLTGRINLKDKLPTFSDGAKNEKVTPTPADDKKTPTSSQNQPYNKDTTVTSNPIKTIPATGVSDFFIPLAFSFLALGFYLKKPR